MPVLHFWCAVLKIRGNSIINYFLFAVYNMLSVSLGPRKISALCDACVLGTPSLGQFHKSVSISLDDSKLVQSIESNTRVEQKCQLIFHHLHFYACTNKISISNSIYSIINTVRQMFFSLIPRRLSCTIYYDKISHGQVSQIYEHRQTVSFRFYTCTHCSRISFLPSAGFPHHTN